MKRYFLLGLMLWPVLMAGQAHLKFTGGKKTKIPFQRINNQVFIPVRLNGIKLTFLLDTGAGQTILFGQQNKDIKLKNVSKMTFFGIGEGDSVLGLKSTGNKLQIGKHLQNDSLTCYVIFDKDFNLSAYVGIPVNGIIGYDFFKDHPVKINYNGERITVYRNRKGFNRKTRAMRALSFRLVHHKPYAPVEVQSKIDKKNQGVLLDSGYGGSLMLFPNRAFPVSTKQPEVKDYLGHGLIGDIYGKRSRLKALVFAGYRFHHLIFSIPDSSSVKNITLFHRAKGALGGEILRRFTCYFDYPNRVLYLKKNRHFSDPFYINMSGLNLKNKGVEWEEKKIPLSINSKRTDAGQKFTAEKHFRYKIKLVPIYVVVAVRKDSPAFYAGLKKGDKLISVNGKKAGDYTLSALYNLLKSRTSKTIKMTVARGVKRLKVKFQLKDPIPFIEGN